MITVDIVSPLGGDAGGVENVIFKWSRMIDPQRINLRIFHCYRGGAYLKGYEKQYSIDKDFEVADINHLIAAYAAFIQKMGAPDVCISTLWPMMVTACDTVRRQMDLTDMRIISWLHSPVSDYEKAGLGTFDDVLKADAHFAINNTLEMDLKRASSDANVFNIGNPVDMKDIPHDPVDPYMLTYVGRLSIEKRIDIILEALYRARGDWRLRIVGDGELRDEVKGWINLLKLQDRVEIIGWREDPWSECRDSRFLVMASEYEGFGLAACEAASQGKTLLSTPVDGITDYIIPGKTGYLYPHEDAQALANILNLLESGGLEPGEPEVCRRSVLRYETGSYFSAVTDILCNMSG